MKPDFDKLAREFNEFLTESRNDVNIAVYLQSVQEALESLKPSSMRDSRRITAASQNLKEIRREFKRMNKHINTLEEQLKILEEGRETNE